MSERTKTIIAACVVAAALGGALALWLWWSAPAPAVVHQRERTDELIERIALAAREADKRAEERVRGLGKEVTARAAAIRKEVRALPADGVALELSLAVREHRERRTTGE